MPASDHEQPTADPIEDLLADLVTLPDHEQAPALERLCELHPSLADGLRERFALFLRIAGPLQIASAAGGGTPRRFGEYTLLRELGSGGMGVVYLASQQRAGGERLVALKLVRDRLSLSPQARERLQREGAAAFRLDHPGICRAYDVGEIDGTPFVSMRYAPGRTLAALLDEARSAGRPIELPADAGDDGAQTSASVTSAGRRHNRNVLLVEQVARALHAAHEAGFVHRDVKPGNIMVGDDGAPVLLDFGLVHDASSSHGLTMTGQPLGTPNYMSPEQVDPRGRRVDRTTDVYSLGVTLFELLTGDVPFRAANREELFQRILTQAPPRLSRLAPGISRDLEVVVTTALDKDPDRRYRTAQDFADDLRAVRLAQPIVARPPGPLRRLSLWSRRNPVAAVMLTLLALSQCVIVALALRAHDRAVEAEAAKGLAERNYQEAIRAITDLGDVASEQLADVPWLSPVRRALFQKVLAFHERTAAQHAHGADTAANFDAARAMIQSAHLHEDLGDNRRADELVDTAEAVLAALEPTAATLRWRVSALLLRSNLEQKRGATDDAERTLRAAIATSETLLARFGGDAGDRQRLGSAHLELAESFADNVQRRDDALRAIEACLATIGASDDPASRLDAAVALRLRARLARRRGDDAGAQADLARGVTILRELVAAAPHGRAARATLANALTSQGLAFKEANDFAQAELCYGEARTVLEGLIAAFPSHVHYRINLARLLSNTAVLQRSAGNAEAAIASLRTALDLSRDATRIEPDSMFAKSMIADCCYNLANHVRRADPVGAERLYAEAIDTLDELLRHNPDTISSLDLACRANTSRGALCASQGRFADALGAFRRARAATERLFAVQQASPRLLRSAAILDFNTGSLLCETGADLIEAVDCLRSAVGHGERALAPNPEDPRAQAMLLSHRVRLAMLAQMLGDGDLDVWRKAGAQIDGMTPALRERLQQDVSSRFDLATAARGLAEVAIADADLQAADASLQRARELLPNDERLATGVELLLVARAGLLLADTRSDTAAAERAIDELARLARRVLPLLDESPLQRRRLRHVLPQVLATVGSRGAGAPMNALRELLQRVQ